MAKEEIKWTEAIVYERLKRVFPSPTHVLLSSVRNGTGFARPDRTIDALAVSVWPSRGIWLAGIEIKVSRSDWRAELKNPHKAEEIQQHCDKWYIAAPKGVVPLEELPENWGLIECTPARARTTKAAPRLDRGPLPKLFIASLLRNFAEEMDKWVPQNEFHKRVMEEVEKCRKGWSDSSSRELVRLQQKIAEFKESSGINIDNYWHYGDIGEAVKLITQSRVSGGQWLDHVVKEAERQRAHIDRFLEHAARAEPQLKPPPETSNGAAKKRRRKKRRANQSTEQPTPTQEDS